VLTPALPPQNVPIFSGFDYVTVDAARRRVYAAHTGAKALLIVDADSGKVIGQVKTGPMHGVAVADATGHVFTGNGTNLTVSEVDPVALKVLRSVKVGGVIDALAYDPSNGHLYADEDEGTRVFVIDEASLTLLKTITIPGRKPEYLAVDPQTHDVYQNIDSEAEIAVIDPGTLEIKRFIKTPELAHNHPLQFDHTYREIVVAGLNGVMSSYTPDGKKLSQIPVPKFDQCDLDQGQHILACGGDGGVTRVQLAANGALRVLDTTPVAPLIHNAGIDAATHAIFAPYASADGSGDYISKFVP
jgi:DNA-binding beta-propeller fold protein YncE